MHAAAHADTSVCTDHAKSCCSGSECRCEHCGCAKSSWIKAFTPGLAVGVILGAFIGVTVSEFGGMRLSPSRPEPGVASTVARDQPPPADADDEHDAPPADQSAGGGH